MEMLFKLIPQLFAVDHNTNTTTQTGTGQDMSPEMKTYYDTELLENARDDISEFFQRLLNCDVILSSQPSNFSKI